MNNLHRLVVSAAAVLLMASSASAAWESVAPGVDYQEFAEGKIDVYVTRVDLSNPRLQVIATRESERGIKVSDFAKREHAIAAINADYFDDKFNPVGLTVGACGRWVGTKDTSREGILAIGDKRAEIHRQAEVMDPPEDWVRTAVSGWPALVVDCDPIDKLPGSDVFTRSPHPRTAVGLSADGRTLYLVVADGRRAGVPGMTLPELATFMADRLGACSAMNLDGGGSSAMWVDGRIVNRPSDGVERPVGDHLAVVAVTDFIACDTPLPSPAQTSAAPAATLTPVRPSVTAAPIRPPRQR